MFCQKNKLEKLVGFKKANNLFEEKQIQTDTDFPMLCVYVLNVEEIP